MVPIDYMSLISLNTLTTQQDDMISNEDIHDGVFAQMTFISRTRNVLSKVEIYCLQNTMSYNYKIL